MRFENQRKEKEEMKKIVGILLAVVLVTSLAVPALASDKEQVDAEAKVGGAGSPPFICAKWETPDHDPAKNGTQILPVPEGKRMVKFYVVAGDPNGVEDLAAIDVTVKYPDGKEKFQLRAIRDQMGTPDDPSDDKWKDPAGNLLRQLAYTDKVDMGANCSTTDPDDLLVPDAMDALDAQGRIKYGLNQTLESVKYDIKYGKQLLIELIGEMDYHQPAVKYKVEVVATDLGGVTTTKPLVNYFWYLSIVALKIDFTMINWQTVNVGVWNYKLGDADMGTPNRPTVQNVGNDPAMLEVHATAMTGTNMGKTITRFDVEMDQLDPTLPPTMEVQYGRVEFDASVPTIITEEGVGPPLEPVLLPPCTPTQIDFSVHPDSGTPSDTYTGKIDLTIKHFQATLP